MSEPNLRSLFRSNDRALAARDVFADRLDEWDAVARSVAAHAEMMRAPQFSIDDFESPRRNVLVFYGVGGIGKSLLSARLERHLSGRLSNPGEWSHLPGGLGQLLPVRIDLSRHAGVDLEAVVLALRVAAGASGRAMPAFDLAIRRYWEANHPGESLEEYVRGHGLLRRVAESFALPEEMASALGEFARSIALPGPVGSLAGQGLRTLVRALREHQQEVRTLARCGKLADLLEAQPDLEALSYYAHLLAWDLAQLPAKHSATLVVLLDTFEDVGDRTHRDRERLLQRIAWLMPNALFIITGRNRLQWDDENLEGQLDWCGAHYWPNLAAGAVHEPRQHRVGYLSSEDCDYYLRQRLSRDGRVLMASETREQVIAHSHGLPLYLDLAVMRFIDLSNRAGRPPGPAEFSYDFPALVARTFRDLSPEERQVLRAVSLLESFSIDLATASAGLAYDAPALRLVERPFIDTDPDTPWPHHVHELVRDAVLAADETSEDRWSSEDWRRAARRAFDAVGRELSHPDGPGGRRRLVASLRQGLALARDFDLELGWLIDAAYRYVADFVWEPIELARAVRPAQPPSAGENAAGALAAALAAVSRRQRVHRRETRDELTRILATGLLPPIAADLARYYLAECQRDLGEHDASTAGMRQVMESGGPLAVDAARGLAHLGRRIGDFRSVLNAIEALGPESGAQRAHGDLWWTQGNMTLACSYYARARDQALANEQRGEAALSQACLAYAAAFQDRGRALEQIKHAQQLLDGPSIRWAELQTEVAQLLCDAGTAPDLPARAHHVIEDAKASGLTSPVAYARLAVCFHHAVLSQQPQLAAARRSLQTCVNGAEFAYLVEITHFLDSTPIPDQLPRTQWVEDPEGVASRWSRLVVDRRAEITGSAS